MALFLVRRAPADQRDGPFPWTIPAHNSGNEESRKMKRPSLSRTWTPPVSLKVLGVVAVRVSAELVTPFGRRLPGEELLRGAQAVAA